MIIYKKTYLNIWIAEKTADSKSVVELGAGFFDKLSYVHPNVKTKIGIEIFKPYIDNAKYNDCVKIVGNLLDYKNLLVNQELDTVMMIDVLEHFTKDVSYKLINDLKKDFNKILLMMPIGVFPQNMDATDLGNDEYQTHRSNWYTYDIDNLKFNDNIVDPEFHATPNRTMYNLDTSCYFGVWKK